MDEKKHSLKRGRFMMSTANNGIQEPLLYNVFNYDLGMMKERKHVPYTTTGLPPLTPSMPKCNSATGPPDLNNGKGQKRRTCVAAVNASPTLNQAFKSVKPFPKHRKATEIPKSITPPTVHNQSRENIETRKRKKHLSTPLANSVPSTPLCYDSSLKNRSPLSPLSTNTLHSRNLTFGSKTNFSPNVSLSNDNYKENLKQTQRRNIPQHSSSFNAGTSGKRPMNEDVEIPFKRLDFDQKKQTQSTSHNYDIEDSCFYDFQHEDSDVSSKDEDFTADLSYDSYNTERMDMNVVKEYVSLGVPDVQCQHCHAWMWKEEHANKSVTRGIPVFSLCCAKGQIRLPKEPPIPSFMWQLHHDKDKSKQFNDGIRIYNSIFAFTSTGGKVDHSINCGGAPYVYRLNGQNHHLFGSLIPEKGDDPRFCQLYIYDTANELSNRLKWVNVADGERIDAEIVDGLLKMLDETNELVKEFRSARDRFEKDGVEDLEIVLKVSRSDSGRENHTGTSDEVAGIMVGDLNETDGSRDIIIHSKINGLERISDIHPKLMALQYPLLFPHGGDGFHKNIPFGKTEKDST